MALAAWTTLLSATPLYAQESSDGSLLSMNEFWNSLPDFVCKERIVSSTVEKGKTKEQHVIESVFLAQRKTKTQKDETRLYSIVEYREVTAIDNKAAPKNAKMPSAPLLFDGLAANILFIADVPRSLPTRTLDFDGRLAVRIGY